MAHGPAVRQRPGARLARCAGAALTLGAALLCGSAQATEYTFNLSNGFFSQVNDGVGLFWQRTVGGPVEGPAALSLPVGWQGFQATRSALDFNITRLPQTEKVVSAHLDLLPLQVNIRGLGSPIGSIHHLDASVPLPAGSPGPSDPRRFGWDAMAAAPVLASLGLGGSFGAYNPFDVTQAVAADHLSGAVTSPFALVENPERLGSLAYVSYQYARLVVSTAAPSPVRYSLSSLGGDRYRAAYELVNEVSRPLSLIDIAFDTSLYDEASLSVSLSGAAAAHWSADLLGSGIGVPAVLSLWNAQGGLGGGATASGFAVDFTWLGGGRPGAQAFTVYDDTSFDTLYSGLSVAAAVPWPPTAWLALAGLALLQRCRRRGQEPS